MNWMQSSPASHHFPTFARLVAGLVAAGAWVLRRLRLHARPIVATVFIFAALVGWREYLVHTQRDAVAAIQRAGGTVSYEWEFRNGMPAQASLAPWRRWLISILGPDLFEHVVAVDLSNPRAADDVVMERVGKLERLEFLSLFNSSVTERGLARVRGLTGLKKLYLHSTGIQGPALAHLERMVNLQDLFLPEVPVTDADVAHLAGMTGLTRLQLKGDGLTNAGLAHLGGKTQLRELHLRHTKITSLEPIRAMTKLTFLDVAGSPIDDAGLKPVAEFQKLQRLWLGQTKVTDVGITHIRTLPNLRRLDLDRTAVSDAGLDLLCDLPRLTDLNLYQTEVTDQGLASLSARLSQSVVRRLLVSGPRVSTLGIESLHKRLPAVQVIGPDLRIKNLSSSSGQ
jgi:internalin A